MSHEKFVFLSYARTDKQIAIMLSKAIADRGIRLWVDYQDLAPGENWAHAIQGALKSASAMIVIASPRSVKSEWVRSELDHIVMRGGAPVLPIVVGGFEYLPPELRHIQAIQLPDPPDTRAIEKAADDIVRALESFARRGISGLRSIVTEQKLANQLASEAEKTGEGATPEK